MKVLATLCLLTVVTAFPQNGGIEPRTASCAKIPSWMKSDLTNRIINGKEAPSVIPWQLAVATESLGIYNPIGCGATILDQTTVLSAAHCFIQDYKKVNQENTYVLAGAQDMTDEPNQRIKVAKFVFTTGKDKFNEDDKINDIVILKLAEPLEFTDGFVQPACLPAANFFPDKKKAIVSGWGKTKYENMQTSDKLMYVDAPLINDADCMKNSQWLKYNEDANGNIQPQMPEIHRSQFCAGYVDGTKKDSCQGDSGGPLVMPLSESDDSAVLVGVVSFGPSGCAVKGYPGIYAKVTYFLPWIKSNMG